MLCKFLYFYLTQILKQGFAIGNGLTDPAIQYGAYSDYALDMGLISKSDYSKINRFLPVCEAGIKLCGNNVEPFFSYPFLSMPIPSYPQKRERKA